MQQYLTFSHNHFYPRSPCGERHEWDRLLPVGNYFYPRSPCGERLFQPKHQYHNFGHFYPRSPCGERPPRLSRVVPTPIFLSTLSLRRATGAFYEIVEDNNISIHALLAESDPRDCPASSPRPYFYPRSPCGERPGAKIHDPGQVLISIHALLAESDRAVMPVSAPRFPFLSTLSLRRATNPSRRRRLW